MVTWIVILLFTGLTLLAGGRLLLLWRETRKLPELLIAVLILGVGTFAVGVGSSLRLLLAPGSLRDAALFVPVIGADVGMAALCLFTWRVYRPSSRVAGAAAAALVSVMAGLLLYAALHGSPQVLEASGVSPIVSCVYTGVMAWSAAEALLYWSAMRRRLRIGLADPMVTNRVLLWGVATGTAATGIAIGAVARHWLGIIDYERSWVALSYAGFGMAAAIAFWLAFKPPRAYARWVARTAPSG